MNKKFLFELSGEHPEMPNTELEEVLHSYSIDFKITNFESENRYKVVDILNFYPNIISELKTRLGMCKAIYEVLAIGSEELKIENIFQTKMSQMTPASTFKLRTKNLKNKLELSKELEKNYINNVLDQISSVLSVDVRSPDIEFVLFFGKDITLTRLVVNIDRSNFETRKPQFRPYFAPISLHPRLARCLVNLSRVKEGNLIMDPFCGTGGILLEAGLMGMVVMGADIEQRMVDGTIANLNHWDIQRHLIFCSDIKNLKENFEKETIENNTGKHIPASDITSIDAIVTEPPYGRATNLRGESMESLIFTIFEVLNEILLSGKRMVISLPNDELPKIVFKYFKILNKFKLRVHRSLTKYIFVFEKSI